MSNIEGLDTFFNNLVSNVIDNAPNIVEKNMKLVEGQAKLLAPVDSGYLRNSITTNVTTNGSIVEGEVTTNCLYAPFVEFGVGKVGEGTYPYSVGNLTYRQDGWVYCDTNGNFHYTHGYQAQPYMYPALGDNKDKVVENIKKDIIKAMGGK